jgi:amino-acid N-acetyltransferase
VGFELCGKVGLVRSLVVSPPLRGRGLGKMLVTFAESKARLEGAEELFLPTISARVFFEQMGYEGIQRCLAPEALQNTAEFSALKALH